MSIKRYSGSAFSEVSTRKRWNGSAWVALTVGKRWNGSAWVDLWSNSSGGGSGESSGGSEATVSGNGTIAKASSTVSSPTVNYSGKFNYRKSGSTLKTAVTFYAWISSASKLGKEIRLTVYVRLNGGSWKSVIIKSDSAVWQNSSAEHSVSVSLNASAKATNTIEWYVTRSGSSYSGTAGNLGSAKSPKKHTFKL